MFSGTLRARDRVPYADAREEGRITAISVFDQGTDVRRDTVRAGRIAKVWGLAEVRIGDALGESRGAHGHFFAPPTLETVVVPGPGTDRGALHLALTRLAEQDPLIGLRHDEIRQETSVSLYGEVQKEVVQATLAEEFGLDVTFRETTPLCVETPSGVGAAVEFQRGGDLQPLPRHRRPARRARPGRSGRGLPAGGRTRFHAVSSFNALQYTVACDISTAVCTAGTAPTTRLTSADAWNDEDLSAVRLRRLGNGRAAPGRPSPGPPLPERHGGENRRLHLRGPLPGRLDDLTWNPVPSSLPNVSRLVGTGQYGLLVWRSNGSTAPSELHLPASFLTASTTVVSDLGTVSGLPSYTKTTPIAAAGEPGGTAARRLLLTAPDSGTVHYALVTEWSDSSAREPVERGAGGAVVLGGFEDQLADGPVQSAGT
ncbi:Elongation factor G [Streptomyces alboniger]